MSAPIREFSTPDDAQIDKEARRILRRLCEAGAYLAIAADLEKAVVLKDNAEGEATRIAVVSRGVAEAFALKDWIERKTAGRIATYQITSAGRAALKRLLAEDPKAQLGFAEAQAPFAAQNRDWGERVMPAAEGPGEKVRGERLVRRNRRWRCWRGARTKTPAFPVARSGTRRRASARRF